MESRVRKRNKLKFICLAIFILMILVWGIFTVFKKKNTEVIGSISPDQKIPVLMYHHLLKNDEKQSHPSFKNKGTVSTVEQFEKQMKYLVDNHYHTLTLQEFEDFMVRKKKLPEKSVLITFDDGLKSNYIYAYPILKKYQMHAVVFVITSRLTDEIEKFNPRELQPLSKTELDQMRDVFEIGSHTHNLHNRSNGEVDLIDKDQEAVKKDIQESKQLLKTDYFCYPFGIYNQKSITILKDLKFHLAFTTNEGYATQENKRLEINRFGISPQVDMKKFADIVSGKVKVTKVNHVSIQQNSGNKLRVESKATGEELRYAYYIYKDNKILEKIDYSSESSLTYKLKESGEYKIKVFIQDKNGDKDSKETPKLQVSI
ncbi:MULTISPECIES: polysaccharide deacetylase family protein [Bacillus cereus group]|uniref:polysaccharide deacetylase family protein n=1 Tax=Bacillus cereus group TaxID=86661 RepID=UPI000BF75749|nr:MULTISPECIES: polysaccharide deacetylase family protein [Bacillus cereus group]PFO80413.1 transcriptional regulator [Bacillus cereus]